jgi:hypothetical protein
MHDYWFGEALCELRSGVDLQVAIIAASFGLDVEDDLARQLPRAGHSPPVLACRRRADWLSQVSICLVLRCPSSLPTTRVPDTRERPT